MLKIQGPRLFGFAKIMAAFTTELFVRQIFRSALGTEDQKLFTAFGAFGAKLPRFTVFCVALWAFHEVIPPCDEGIAKGSSGVNRTAFFYKPRFSASTPLSIVT